MNILFVHQNFPAQFIHLAPALQKRGHKVVALKASANTLPSPVPVAAYPWTNRSLDEQTFGLARNFADMVERGRIVAEAASVLKERDGFNPDVIVSHVGWGEPMFLKEVWPNARHILYVEFYYHTHGKDVGFDPEFGAISLQKRMRVASMNASLLMSFETADRILTPTQFQAGLLPDRLQTTAAVIHDGIDTETVCPSKTATVAIPETTLRFQAGDELITFVSRSLEPYRGFHIFMRALPQVLAARPRAQVVIVGDESRGYGGVPAGDWTWKKLFLREVGEKLDMSRVHFVGKVPKPALVGLLQATRVHCYLTYPFVLSWSLLEAMSAGALVVGSKTPPVEEAITDGVNGRLVDFFDVDGLARTLIESLAEPDRFTSLRQDARRSVVERFDLRTVCLPRLVDLVEGKG